MTKRLWALDAGNAQVLSVDPTTGNTTKLSTGTGFPKGALLNALTFDAAGIGYVTDSANGAIYQIARDGGQPHTWFQSDALLKPAAGLTPTFGANGIEFRPVGCNPVGTNRCDLFVANTANRQIIQITTKSDGTPDRGSVFVNGINGPDGIAFDDANNLWVCAGQEDEIVVIQTETLDGKVIAKLGDFEGLDKDGRVKGLLFPTSLAFSNDKKTLYVSNLASPNASSIDSPWARQVKIFTVSKLTGFPIPIPDSGLFK
jgi:sugar lactone lactonase YvrE